MEDVVKQVGQAKMGQHPLGMHLIHGSNSLFQSLGLRSPRWAPPIRKATAAEIETIDMARRGIHNGAAELLLERLDGKVETDFATARRLFTLICVLHIRG